MAVIHKTTVTPDKLTLLTTWLPGQPWYRGTGRAPELAKVGGFRLDDPQGEVGIEFMVVTDASEDEVTTYQVPLTYRGDALAGAGGALIGTAEHGVLGQRWIYDGVHDPVLTTQLVALIQGETQAQAQSVSNSADPTVISKPVAAGPVTAVRSAVAANGAPGTDLQLATAGPDGSPHGHFTVWINRVLRPGESSDVDRGAGQPCLSATWRLPDGTSVRGVFACARYTLI